MKNNKIIILGLTSLLMTVSAAADSVSQSPLFLTQGAAPNIVFSLDDSGSMGFAHGGDAYWPSSVGLTYYNPSGSANDYAIAEPRYTSPTSNPYYYNPETSYQLPLKNDGTTYSTSWEKAWLNGFIQENEGWVDLTTGFNPTIYYFNKGDAKKWRNGGSGDHPVARPRHIEEHKGASKGYYHQYNQNNAACNNSLGDSDCFTLIYPTTAEEKQNFAIWYSFYRTRALLTMSAATLSFRELPKNTRFSWQALNTCNSFSDNNEGEGNCANNFGDLIDSRLQTFSSTHRDNFFNWLAKAPVRSAGTPLRNAFIRAGNLFSQASSYQEDPLASDSTSYSCRRNYHIAMTDGFWSGSPAESHTDASDTSTILPDGTSYAPSTIFSSDTRASANGDQITSLADIAFHFWSNDLKDTDDDAIDNNLSAQWNTENQEYWNPRNNPASWQHMVNFTVGLAMKNYLTNPQYDGTTFGGGFLNIGNGDEQIQWPTIIKNGTNAAYDLWQAAINSRGLFFSAENSASLTAAFKEFVSAIKQDSASAAATGVNGFTSDVLSSLFHVQFESEFWSGDVRKRDLTANATPGATVWSAAETIAAMKIGDRKYLFAKKGATNNLEEFKWNFLPENIQSNFGNGDSKKKVYGKKRLQWVKGNHKDEGTAADQLRIRKTLPSGNISVLGDIVHSSPVYVGKPDRYGYQNLHSASYADFAALNANRKHMVYFGANDGMLHGLDAENGNEVFAFIPTPALKKIHLLPEQNYSHQYYVDATPVAADVWFDDKWHSVLIGGLGAGGKGIYALDITTPETPKLLWELTAKDDSRLGYTLAQPRVIRAHDGNWYVALANGYESTASSNQSAHLFLLNIETGAIEKTFSIGNETDNGLSSPVAADINGDLITDFLYAGDLKGNLWRFDLINHDSSEPLKNISNKNQWKVAGSNLGEPLFAASKNAVPQPITTPPRLMRHPTTKGHLIIFGTGKYFETSDAAKKDQNENTLYGIWDQTTDGKTELATINFIQLLKQELLSKTSATFSGQNSQQTQHNVYQSSQKKPTWYGTEANLGWYMHLPAGDLMAHDPVYRTELAFFPVSTPNADPCQASGLTRYLYVINAATGGRSQQSVFDLNNDQKIDEKDKYLSKSITALQLTTPALITLIGDIAYLNQTDDIATMLIGFPGNRTGRQNWLRLF
ncbi:pilus assembly protein [Pelagibaculum spongiae]|uniref:PilY1 beta-propeller domain-containing protein n=1 Tax=Pelagibaculum spongiae TaxID=2080658 RepID=A0A2V1GWJ3_9GAMM|nr:PilC/PilY family type IV pilus protein [Pelagibaculum spongiae]PVZ71551.1 hypothetical protein DC094_00460 [Pelagibaculum spongiae]